MLKKTLYFSSSRLFFYSFILSITLTGQLSGLDPEVEEHINNYKDHIAQQENNGNLKGASVLHSACVHRDEEVVMHFLETSPEDFFKKDSQNYTPLDLLAFFPVSSENMRKILQLPFDRYVKILAEQGINTYSGNVDETLCMHYLRYACYDTVVTLFSIKETCVEFLKNSNSAHCLFTAACLSTDQRKISFITQLSNLDHNTLIENKSMLLESICKEAINHQPKTQTLREKIARYFTEEETIMVSRMFPLKKTSDFISLYRMLFDCYLNMNKSDFFTTICNLVIHYDTSGLLIDELFSCFNAEFSMYYNKSFTVLSSALMHNHQPLIKQFLTHSAPEHLLPSQNEHFTLFSLAEQCSSEPTRQLLLDHVEQELLPLVSDQLKAHHYKEFGRKFNTLPVLIALYRHEYSIARYFIITEPKCINQVDDFLELSPVGCIANLLAWYNEHQDAQLMREKYLHTKATREDSESTDLIKDVDPEKLYELLELIITQPSFNAKQLAKKNHTILHYAAMADRKGSLLKKVLALFKKKSLCTMPLTTDGDIPLLSAARTNNYTAYRILLESHDNEHEETTLCNYSNSTGDSALTFAIQNYNFEFLLYLLKKKVKIAFSLITEALKNAANIKDRASFVSLATNISLNNYSKTDQETIALFAFAHAIVFFDYDCVKKIIAHLGHDHLSTQFLWWQLIPFAIEVDNKEIVASYLEDHIFNKKSPIPIIQNKSMLHLACKHAAQKTLHYLEQLTYAQWSFIKELTRKDDQELFPFHYLLLALKSKKADLLSCKDQEEKDLLTQEIEEIITRGKSYISLVNKPLSFYQLNKQDNLDLEARRRRLAIQTLLKEFFQEIPEKTKNLHVDQEQQVSFSNDERKTKVIKKKPARQNNKKAKSKKHKEISSQERLAQKEKTEDPVDDLDLRTLIITPEQTTPSTKKIIKNPQRSTVALKETEKQKPPQCIISYHSNRINPEQKTNIAIYLVNQENNTELNSLYIQYLQNLDYSHLKKINDSPDMFHSFSTRVEKEYARYGKKMSETDLTTNEITKAYAEYGSFYDKIVQIDIETYFGSTQGSCEYIFACPSPKNPQAKPICLHRFFNKKMNNRSFRFDYHRKPSIQNNLNARVERLLSSSHH